MSAGSNIQDLGSILLAKEEEVENALTKMQDGAEGRKRARKDILKRELEVSMLSLSVQEVEMTRKVRGQILQALFSYKEEAVKILKDIKVSTDEDDISTMTQAFEDVISKMSGLYNFTDLEVAVDIQGFREAVQKYIYIKPKMISPLNFKLFVRPFPESRPRAVIVATHAEDFRNELVLTSMDIEYTALAAAGQLAPTFPIFRSTLWDLMKSSLARMKTETSLEIDLPPSPTCRGRVKVKLFGLDIQDGGSKQFSVISTPQGDISLFNIEDMIQENGCSCSLLEATTSTLQTRNDNVEGQLTRVSPNVGPTEPAVSSAALSDALEALLITEDMVSNMLVEKTPENEVICSGVEAVSKEHEADRNRQEVSHPQPNTVPGGQKAGRTGQEVVSEEQNDESASHSNSIINLSSALGISCYDCLDSSCLDVTAFVQQRWNAVETEDNYVLHNESSVQDYLQLDPHSFQRRSNVGQTSLLQRSFAGHGSFHGSFLDSYMAQAGIGDRSSADISVLDKSAYKVRPMLNESEFWSNRSIWEPAQPDTAVRFSCDEFVVENLDPCRTIARSCTRTMKCLESPAYMAVEPDMLTLLVSEPTKNRIGVYELATLSFKGWFPNTCNPKQMAYLDEDYVAVVVSRGIDIFRLWGHKYKLHQTIAGQFRGLVCVDGRLYTTESRGNSCQIRGFERDGTDIYSDSSCSQITCIEGSTGQVNLQDLAVSDMVFYVSDAGKARIYVIDINTGVQSAEGYYGDTTGRWRCPAGLCLDDVGDLLVVDTDLNKLVVLNINRVIIREIPLEAGEKWRRRPVGLLRVGNTVLIAFQGDPGSDGGLVRYRIHPDF